MTLDPQKRARELREQIRYHDDRYYLDNKPLISDAEYDHLYRELKEIEEAHPLLVVSDSPTQKVAGKADAGFKPFLHEMPLLSLESLFTEQSVRDFQARIQKDVGDQFVEYVVEPKFDGLSVEVIYKNGEYHSAGTRGDGVQGEDVTEQVRTIKNLPKKLHGQNIPKELHLRAEVIMTVTGFLELNKHLIELGEEPFANPRNAASGALRQLDASITATRPLEIFFYSCLLAPDWNPSTHWNTLEQLKNWGVSVNDDRQVVQSVEGVLEYHQNLFLRRDQLNYEIDGIVAKVNSLYLQKELGERTRTPRWAFALKFESRKEVTIIEDIVVQVGRQGTLTPVAVLKPVDVGGVTVSRATLHNLDIIQKLDVRVGDEVKVARAGDVIPEVVEVHVDKRPKNSIPFSMLQSCPVCGANVKREGAFFFCQGGYQCPAQLKWGIIHFASRRAMDIEGLGKETVEALLTAKLIRTPADLYQLTRDDLLKLDGFKDKKADNLLQGIQKSRTQTLARFIFGLGIRHVGEQTGELLANAFQNIRVLQKANLDQLLAIHGVGPESAQSVIDFFSLPETNQLLDQFEAGGLRPVHEQKQGSQVLLGKTFVFTGELQNYSRDEAESLVKSYGGSVTSSVSKKTSYVVCGDSAGSKKEKAIKLGVPLLSEQEFQQLMATKVHEVQ